MASRPRPIKKTTGKKKDSAPGLSGFQGELERLLNLTHGDPHSFLGLHPEPGGTMVRIFRPDAQIVRIRAGKSEWIELDLIHARGLFEKKISDAIPLEPYEVEVNYPDGHCFRYWDPYSFWPTLGEMDLYLVGEGTHENLYERMGARLKEWQGVKGAAFAVWAPSAKSVSAVGDFNGWDGRLHS
ncbi:MAG: GlgB N-terminal domain-containing protein, partial [bacterium]